MAKNLTLPRVRVEKTYISLETWESINEDNILILVLKVIGKALLFAKRTMEILTEVLWNIARDLKVSYEGVDLEGLRLYIATFEHEEELQSILDHASWAVGVSKSSYKGMIL